MKPECIECGDTFSPKRLALGLKTCLECGDKRAAKQILHKSRCIAPAYNKGGYMYITSRSMAKDAGK